MVDVVAAVVTVTGKEDTEDVMLVRARKAVHQENSLPDCKRHSPFLMQCKS